MASAGIVSKELLGALLVRKGLEMVAFSRAPCFELVMASLLLIIALPLYI